VFTDSTQGPNPKETIVFTKTRILALCAAVALAFPALAACSTYHDATYHDATYHDACNPTATTIVSCAP
jgi:outer membrane protein assembly factor BamE (lipoprotein component of BamABCDE complex)